MKGLISSIASVLRGLPDFRGKHRLGKTIESVTGTINKWEDTEVKIKMKDGFYMTIDVRSGTHHGTFWTGNYDSALIRKLITLLSPDDIILDIGSNIGCYAVPFAKYLKAAGGKGKVYCFEPVHANFAALSKNIEDNLLKEQAVLYNNALGEKDGVIEMLITEKGKTSNAVMNLDKDYAATGNFINELAPVKKMDDFYVNENIPGCNFIKIDIEGAEIFFMQGGIGFLDKFRPLIYGEFNSYFLEKFGYSFMDIWSLMEPLGYSCYKQIGKKSFFEPVQPKKGLNNILLVPPGYNTQQLADAGLIQKG